MLLSLKFDNADYVFDVDEDEVLDYVLFYVYDDVIMFYFTFTMMMMMTMMIPGSLSSLPFQGLIPIARLLTDPLKSSDSHLDTIIMFDIIIMVRKQLMVGYLIIIPIIIMITTSRSVAFLVMAANSSLSLVSSPPIDPFSRFWFS